MFDRRDRLIVCNQRYAQMYNLPEELIRPGAHWLDIVAHRPDRFGYRGLDLAAVVTEHEALDLTNVELTRTRELDDGRIIFVRHQPIAEGGWVATHDDITERRKADELLHNMARHDALTGLPNRAFAARNGWTQAVARLAGRRTFCGPVPRPRSFQGDQRYARPPGWRRASCGKWPSAASRHCGRSDTVARIGGDEFAIVQTGDRRAFRRLGARQTASSSYQRTLRDRGSADRYRHEHRHCLAPGDGRRPALLLRKADIALYRVKAEGRRGYRFFEAGMDAELQSRRKI